MLVSKNLLYMLKKISFFIIILLIASCTKDQFVATVPSYLHIESIDLQTESFEGSDSQKITDAWVTMDGVFLGAFEVPCTIPILDEGEHEFRVLSGIKANGISATRITYPFYDVCDLYVATDEGFHQANSNTIELFKDSTVVVKAYTKYTDNTDFLFIEDFEDAGSIIEMSEFSDTTLIKTNVDSLVFEGYGSGVIYLDTINDLFELVSSEFVTLPSLYNQTMLEMDYKCDHSFKLGVAIKSSETGAIERMESIHISPSSEWNKIYVHMTNQINLGSSGDEFGVFIGTLKSNSVESATFYFDNIKWLHEQ